FSCWLFGGVCPNHGVKTAWQEPHQYDKGWGPISFDYFQGGDALLAFENILSGSGSYFRIRFPELLPHSDEFRLAFHQYEYFIDTCRYGDVSHRSPLGAADQFAVQGHIQ